MEKEKWYTGHLPQDYPTRCNTAQLKDVIQDLQDEYYRQKQSGKNNIIWENLITQLMKSGRDELAQRILAEKEEIKRFSMNNPVIYVLIVLLIAALAYLVYKLDLPFRFWF